MGGFPAQCHFRPVYPENTWIAARSASRCGNRVARHKSEFHKPLPQIFRQIQAVDNALISFPQIGQPAGSAAGFLLPFRPGARNRLLLDTQLHDNPSIGPVYPQVKLIPIALKQSTCR